MEEGTSGDEVIVLSRDGKRRTEKDAGPVEAGHHLEGTLVHAAATAEIGLILAPLDAENGHDVAMATQMPDDGIVDEHAVRKEGKDDARMLSGDVEYLWSGKGLSSGEHHDRHAQGIGLCDDAPQLVGGHLDFGGGMLCTSVAPLAGQVTAMRNADDHKGRHVHANRFPSTAHLSGAGLMARRPCDKDSHPGVVQADACRIGKECLEVSIEYPLVALGHDLLAHRITALSTQSVRDPAYTGSGR